MSKKASNPPAPLKPGFRPAPPPPPPEIYKKEKANIKLALCEQCAYNRHVIN